MSKTRAELVCGMFPDPQLGTEWMQKGNKLLSFIANSLAVRGVQCVRTPARPSRQWMRANKSKVDVIHLNWPEMYYRLHGRLVPGIDLIWAWWFVRTAREYGLKYVWTVHDLYPHGTGPTNASRTEKAARKLLFQNAHAAFVNCASSVPIVTREFGPARRCIAAPLGNFRAFYPDKLSEGQAREALGFSPDDFVFLVFGTQRKSRNASEVIQAFNHLKGENLRLMVVGQADRSVRSGLKAAATDSRVNVVLEFIPEDKVEVYLKACDFLIMPGHYYLTSAVVMLGLAYSRPVIVPTWGCSKEMIGEAGYVYDETQPGGLPACMEKALSADRARLRSLADQRARLFSWETTANQLIKGYK